MLDATTRDSLLGLGIATAILTAWGAMLALLLVHPWPARQTALWPAFMALQTFLHTGLFITSHDAIHGTVFPAHRGVNNAIGRLASRLYALFPFETLREKHRAHHDSPVDDDDPDHHDDGRDRFWPWYFGFVGNYVGVAQIVGMAVVFNVLHHLGGVPVWRLQLFWVVPSIASTLQLFYFGTYRPHRRPDEGFDDEHRATSSALPVWATFLTCYHFGRHHAHHARPDVPWWRLPAVREAPK